MVNLFFYETRQERGEDILAVLVEGEGEPQVVVGTEYNEANGRLSPDGQWLAYESDVTAQREIWVRLYPGSGAPIRISTNGGTDPVWSRGRAGTLLY